MAIRNIRKSDDELLRKKSRAVEEINSRILTLIDDMIETMYKEDGVGLACTSSGNIKESYCNRYR